MNDKLIKNWYKAQKAGAVLPCPRCGNDRMGEILSENSLSRRADIYICSQCGTEEALEDFKQINAHEDSYKESKLKNWFLMKCIDENCINSSVPHAAILTFKKSVRLTDMDIWDIMDAAINGGISHWCEYAEYMGTQMGKSLSEHLSSGGSLMLHTDDGNGEYILSKEKFIYGFGKAIEEGYGSRWVDNDGNVQCGEIDSEAADVIVQFALFDEIIYG